MFQRLLAAGLLWAVATLPAHAQVAARPFDPNAFRGAVDQYYAGKLFHNSRGEGLPYRLFIPVASETREKRPLVLNLEGTGSQGNDLTTPPWRPWPLLFLYEPAQRQYPCFVLTPRCLREQTWAGYGRQQPEMTQSLRLTMELLDAVCKDFPVDPDRIYVRGFSMGGFGTWDVVTRFPDRFAAAVPISGGGDPSTAARIRKLPVWAFHGANDPTVPVSLTRAMIEALRQAGGNPRYTEFPGTGHGDCLGKMEQEKDFLPWLFAQRRDAGSAGAKKRRSP